MTKRDLFRILIKIIGLYSLISTIFTSIPINLSYLNLGIDLTTFLLIFGLPTFMVFIYILLILKTDKLIDILKVDKGFDDEKIQITNFSAVNLLNLGLILISGLMIVDNLPIFLQNTFLEFKDSVAPKNEFIIKKEITFETTNTFNWALSTINTFFGWLILTNYQKISNWILKRNLV